MNPEEWPLPAELIVELPLEAVALDMLRELVRRERSHHHRQYVVGINGMYASRGTDFHRFEVLMAVNEAWDWLYINGCMADDPDQPEGFRVLTRKGVSLAKSDRPDNLLLSERMLANPLHSSIENKVRTMFLLGAFESAVFESFKQLEVRVRTLARLSQSVIGKAVMQNAFGKEGPLRDKEADPGEQDGMLALYTGAIQTMKNPSSHRNVDFDEPILAAEAVLFADLLHRMLDRVEALTANPH